jgi:pyridoxine/pyridoxamine 5'-phosphate oxidase
VVFSTAPHSVKGKNLARDPNVVVHLESGDEVVILEGEVEDLQLDEATADAYGEKYGYRPEVDSLRPWLRLRPRRALAWIESEYPDTATRFEWD